MKISSNEIFYKGLNKQKPEEIKESICKLLEEGAIIEDESKRLKHRREYLTTRDVTQLRIHVLVEPRYIIGKIEETIQPED